MTKNEYQKYLRELANRVHTEPGYTIKKFHEDSNAVEVEPWDLSRFSQLDEHTVKMINVLFNEDCISNDGQFMVRGSSFNETETKALGCICGDYSNSYSYYAHNDKEFLIYTYCEGDTTLTIYPDKDTYAKGLEETRNWYKEEYGYEDEEEREPAQTPPKEISDRAKAITKRFIINGSSDEMYIANVIAHCNGLGDGESHFNGKTEIIAATETAKRIQGAYGCNIDKSEIAELENIIITGTLDKAMTLTGIQNFIDRKKKEKKACNDEWRKEYLTKEIAYAKEVMEECKQNL